MSRSKPAKRPSVRSARAWSFPEPVRGELDNGLTTLAYHLPGQHVVSVRLAVPLPLTREPHRIEGVGTLMARTLDEGTTRWSAEQMAELLERRGVALGAGVGERGFVVELDVARRRLPDALDLLRQALSEPAFGEAEVRRNVRARLSDIEQELASPGQRAAIEFIRSYYPATSRLSRPTGGTAASVSEITSATLADYHRATLGPAGGTVVLAGDLSEVDVERELEAGLGAWQDPAQRESPETVTTVGRGPDAHGIVLVDRPGAVQSELYLGCPGPGRDVDGGWAPYPVLSFLIGGAPQARLDARLREEKGYTYGMRCGFRPRVGAGLFVTSGAVRADATAPALGDTFDILRAARDGFTDEETRSGVDFLCETAPGRYATADAVADEAISRALEGLDTQHTTATLRQMRELTPKRLRRAYRAYVADDDRQWLTVVVGDAERIGPSLAALAADRGLGPVRMLER